MHIAERPVTAFIDGKTVEVAALKLESFIFDVFGEATKPLVLFVDRDTGASRSVVAVFVREIVPHNATLHTNKRARPNERRVRTAEERGGRGDERARAMLRGVGARLPQPHQTLRWRRACHRLVCLVALARHHGSCRYVTRVLSLSLAPRVCSLSLVIGLDRRWLSGRIGWSTCSRFSCYASRFARFSYANRYFVFIVGCTQMHNVSRHRKCNSVCVDCCFRIYILMSNNNPPWGLIRYALYEIAPGGIASSSIVVVVIVIVFSGILICWAVFL